MKYKLEAEFQYQSSWLFGALAAFVTSSIGYFTLKSQNNPYSCILGIASLAFAVALFYALYKYRQVYLKLKNMLK